MMDIVSKKDAKNMGLDFYYTGKKCKYGHLSKRRVSCGQCLECDKSYSQPSRIKKLKNRIERQDKIKKASDKYGEKIISLEDAKEKGLNRYFTGLPCEHGHISERLVINGSCHACVRIRQKKLDLEGKEKRKQKRLQARRELEEKLGREIILLSEAKERGLDYYFTGVPCKRGHLVVNKVKKPGCTECRKTEAYRAKHGEDAVKPPPPEPLEEYKHLIVTKEYAKANNLKRYFPAIPCKYGHVSERNMKGMCLVCKTEKDIKRRAKKFKKDPEYRERVRKYAREKWHKLSDEDKEKRYKYMRKYYSSPEQKAKILAFINRRRAIKLNATPSWSDQKVCESIYLQARRISKETGIKHCVDHYYPLQGKNVTGLHIPDNLKIIPSKENNKKSNKMPEDFYGEGGREEWLKRQ